VGILDFLAKLGLLVPSTPRPRRKQTLGRRLLYTFIVAVIFVILGSIPIYGIEHAGRLPVSPIVSVVLAMRQGTLAQLGIGPIVTAGLVLQILVGARLIKLDLTNPEDRKTFTLASKGLAVIFAGIEAAGFVLSGMYWTTPSLIPLWVKAAVFLQLVWGSIVIIMLDEAVQKGWGLGSGVSLFILIGVAQTFFNDLFSFMKAVPPYMPYSGHEEVFGLIPYIAYSLMNGTVNWWYVGVVRMAYGYPSILGLVVTVVILAILTYLTVSRIQVPITSPRLRGIRTRIPLQLLYVTNIPVLLTSILLSDIMLFSALAQRVIGYQMALTIRRFVISPTLFTFVYDPIRAAVYTAVFLGLSILFGILWIEIAGLNPEAQAENLIKSGLEIPGMRRNPKILANYLARYIYPLTIFSSIVVAIIALVGNILGTYGTGVGLLLAIGILYNYYQLMIYERTLEMYPALKRFLGEE